MNIHEKENALLNFIFQLNENKLENLQLMSVKPLCNTSYQ